MAAALASLANNPRELPAKAVDGDSQREIAALPLPTGTALLAGSPISSDRPLSLDNPVSPVSPVSSVAPGMPDKMPDLSNPRFPDPDLPDPDLTDPNLTDPDERLELAEELAEDWDHGFNGAGDVTASVMTSEMSLDERLELDDGFSEDPAAAGAIAEVELLPEPRPTATRKHWRNGALAAVLVAAVGGFLLVNQHRVNPVLSGLATQLGLDADDQVRIDKASETPGEAPAEEPPKRPTESEPAVVTAGSGDGELRLDQARAAIANQQYSEALALLQQIPDADHTFTYEAVLARAQAGVSQANQANISALAEAKRSIQPTEATPFVTAIAQAQQIPPGEPDYEQAQQDIDRWSQVILDLAEGRAASGNLADAIAAAQALPMERPQIYEQAQERIAFWQQRLNSRQIIQAAQAIIQPGQASTYQQGIVKLAAVPVEHPEYDTANQLRDEWSERMFSIAQVRAAQGLIEDAIRAAVLVPAGTAAYEPAQQAIQHWQALS